MNDDDDDDAFVEAASESSEDDERAFADAASPAELFPLHCAAFANDVKRIRELLASVDDMDANALDGAGHTALHVAALRMAIGAVKTLCADARVDVNATSARGWSALRLAIHSRTRACARTRMCSGPRRTDTRSARCGSGDARSGVHAASGAARRGAVVNDEWNCIINSSASVTGTSTKKHFRKYSTSRP